MARLLLAEFLSGLRKRNERGLLFPFVAGLASRYGVAARWIVGTPRTTRPTGCHA